MSDSNSSGTTDRSASSAGSWTVETQTPPQEGVIEALQACLQAHNEAVAGVSPESRSFTWIARDAEGVRVGGLAAEARYGWLHIRLLWVNAERRGDGAGGALLDAAEAAAESLDLRGLLTDTSSFQAPGFYTGRGFEIVGRVEDLPPGHTTYYLMKRRTPAAE